MRAAGFKVCGVTYPKPVGKRYWLEDGVLHKEIIARRDTGRAISRVFSSWAEYVEYRQGVDARTMFTSGLFDEGVRHGAPVQYKGAEGEGGVSASNDFLAFRPGVPSIMRIDCDFKRKDEIEALWPDPLPAYQHPKQLIKVLLKVVPELRGVAMLGFASSSSLIFHGHDRLRGPGGLRIEVPVADSGMIPDLLRTIHARLWIAGHGWAFTDKAGRFQERSLVDLALGRQHQPDFAAPDLGPGLWQQRGWTVADGGMLTGLPALSLAQEEAYTEAADRAKAALKPDCVRVAQAARDRHTRELVARGVPQSNAERATQRRFDRRLLTDDDVLYTASGAAVPVRDLLPNGAQFDRAKFRDPIEPDYDGGRPVAMFFWRNGAPGLSSFAHGQTWFQFESVASHFDMVGQGPAALLPNRLIDGVPPSFPAKAASYDDAVTALVNNHATIILDAVLGDATPEIEVGAAGLGKTSSLVAGVARQGLITNIYVPSLRLAEELAQHAGPCTIIRGRAQTEDVLGVPVPLCRKADVVVALAEKGVTNVARLLCVQSDGQGSASSKCTYINECAYLRQFKSALPIRIYAHAYLALDECWVESFAPRKPALSIVDEDPLQALIERQFWPLADLKEAGGLLTDVAGLLSRGEPLADGLRDRYNDPVAELRALLAQADTPALHLHPATPKDVALRAAKALPKASPFTLLLEALLRALEGGHDAINNVWLGVDAERRENVHAALVRKPIRLTRNAGKVVLLDATPNLEAWRAVFRMFGMPDPHVTEIHAERQAIVVQCYDTPLSKRRLSNADVVDDLVGYVDALAARFGSVGVCGPKGEVVEALRKKLPRRIDDGSVVAANFGGLRGLNSLKDTAVGVVVGRNLPPAFAVEGEARAIWPYEALVLPGQYVDAPSGYRMRDGREVGLMVQSHPDPRVRSILRQKRESESEQAIDRHRLIHRDVPKLIVLLSSLPLDIAVDALVDFKKLVGYRGLAAAVSLAGGVLPLSAAWLAAFQTATFPKGQNAAEHWVRRVQTATFPKGCGFFFKPPLSLKQKRGFSGASNRHFPTIYIEKVAVSPFALVNYRVNGIKGGKTSKAVATWNSRQVVRAMLALHHDVDEADINVMRWEEPDRTPKLLFDGHPERAVQTIDTAVLALLFKCAAPTLLTGAVL